MSKFNTTPAGYKVSVTSYENDMDDYSTLFIHGLTMEQARLYVDLSRLLAATGIGRRSFGNMPSPSQKEIEDFYLAFSTVCQKHADTLAGLGYSAESYTDIGGFYETFVDITSNLIGSSYKFYTRFVDEITVEYIPQPVAIQDVTHLFGPA